MTRVFDKHWIKTSIVEQMKARAELYKGRVPNDPAAMVVIDACRAQYIQRDLTTLLIYTIDDGMHDIGWWKNPDYARCWHLSLSYWYPDSTVAPKWNAATQEWIRLFFNPHERWVWAEPPHSAIGKQRGVWHYRLFADPNWQPIFPEGEVYSTLKTERGWLSHSEVMEKIRREAEIGRERS